MNERTAGVVALETVTQGGIKFRALDETNPGSLRTVLVVFWAVRGALLSAASAPERQAPCSYAPASIMWLSGSVIGPRGFYLVAENQPPPPCFISSSTLAQR